MAKRGWKLSPETRARMSAARAGRTVDAATRAKLSASQKRYWQRVHELLARDEVEREQRAG
jgi:hypothetical protein